MSSSVSISFSISSSILFSSILSLLLSVLLFLAICWLSFKASNSSINSLSWLKSSSSSSTPFSIPSTMRKTLRSSSTPSVVVKGQYLETCINDKEQEMFIRKKVLEALSRTLSGKQLGSNLYSFHHGIDHLMKDGEKNNNIQSIIPKVPLTRIDRALKVSYAILQHHHESRKTTENEKSLNNVRPLNKSGNSGGGGGVNTVHDPFASKTSKIRNNALPWNSVPPLQTQHSISPQGVVKGVSQDKQSIHKEENGDNDEIPLCFKPKKTTLNQNYNQHHPSSIFPTNSSSHQQYHPISANGHIPQHQYQQNLNHQGSAQQGGNGLHVHSIPPTQQKPKTPRRNWTIGIRSRMDAAKVTDRVLLVLAEIGFEWNAKNLFSIIARPQRQFIVKNTKETNPSSNHHANNGSGSGGGGVSDGSGGVFPLYRRGVEPGKFERATNMLAADIEQVLWCRSVRSEAVMRMFTPLDDDGMGATGLSAAQSGNFGTLGTANGSDMLQNLEKLLRYEISPQLV
mmetsp:Transcript_32760/g.38414  ORF Transcript_32760/g.38414 Transcript_32760/m.38414 type:complete len:511 (-) Transcript_32760:59-1591(-)